MLTGAADRFAIEAHPEEYLADQILGRFRFWLGGEQVGDWEDMADLRGCVSWLRDFSAIPRDRFDPRLEGQNPEGVFALVYDPVFGSGGVANPMDQPIPYAYERFHVGHLGMSSLERFDILLVKTVLGRERCLWRKAGDSRIREVVLAADEMEGVAGRFCDEFERAYPLKSNQRK